MTQSQWARLKVLVWVVVSGGSVIAQNPGVSTFDVVSIKRHVGDEPGLSNPTPNGHTAVNVPFSILISLAYPVQRSEQIIGAPDWFYEATYDVIARFTGTPTAEQRRDAWRSLFGDRLKLRAHLETRETDTFALVLAQSGRVNSNLKKSEIDCSSADAVADCTRLSRGLLTTLGMSMTDLARSIQPMTGRTVFDRTGLTGFHAFSLRFLPTRPGPRSGSASTRARRMGTRS